MRLSRKCEKCIMDIEIVYNYNDFEFKVVGSQELHDKLQSDREFLKKYISEKSYTAKIQKFMHDFAAHDDARVWNHKTVLLLLDLLEKNKLDLRNPKIRKKYVWRKIRDELIKHGTKNVDEIMVERKFRNMKFTYRTLKDKKKTTTMREAITWDYYEAMDKIFKDDKVFNERYTVSSMQCESPTISTSVSHNSNKLDVSQVVLCQNLPTPHTEVAIEFSPEPSQGTKSVESLEMEKKTAKEKQLYNLRKKRLEVEKDHVKELLLIRKAIEKNNAIQAKRNDLFERFLEKYE